ncbi:MAG TPA: hypothetical protein VMR18_03290 [Candidatus Saccharimonadales bacterium]|jgi:hypothetical protein|nr:hypothetical protein [Candidatus Saccharimonadales bacterium]
MRGFRFVILTIYIVSFLFVSSILSVPLVHAAYFPFPNRSDELSTSVPGATGTQVFSFQILDTTDILGSIEFQYCSNSPLQGDSCTAPPGVNVTNAVLSNQSGNIGFYISADTTTSDLIIDRIPRVPTSATNVYQFDDLVNPSAVGTFYIRISIHTSNFATSADNEFGGLALSTANQLTLNTVVPPYLSFCAAITISNQDCSTATGSSIDFGTFTPNTTSDGASQFTAATNAGSGYSVTDQGTTLTSGNNYLPPLSTPTSSTSGVSQFGINLTINSTPPTGSSPTGNGNGIVSADYDLPNKYLFNAGDVVVSSSTVSNPQTFTVSYIANISNQQAPGVYVTTISYICLGNF